MEKLIEAVRIRDKMLQCRKSAKFIEGDEWPETFKKYKKVFESVMLKHNCDEIQAVLKLHELPSVKDNGVMSMLIFAVCAEILEPEQLNQK